jgi:phosphoribosylformylglycinamidine synthase
VVVQHSPADWLLALLEKTGDPEPIYSRFDQTVGNRTVRGPGEAACAVLRLPGSQRGFALTLTGRGDLCAADPYLGTQASLAEAVRRLACVGASPLAVTDGLNFASPRDPQEYGRVARVIAGLGDGLRALGVPVSGGNVSLYTQSPEGPIPPTPMIGALGLVQELAKLPGQRLQPGQQLLLLGRLGDQPVASLYARLRWGGDLGLPACDLPAEQRLAAWLRELVARELVAGLWPVTMGGLLTTLAKVCARQQVGADLALPSSPRPHWQLFGEYPAQVLVAGSPEQVRTLMALAAPTQIPAHHLGTVAGARLRLRDQLDLPIAALRAWLSLAAEPAGAEDEAGHAA